MFIIESSSGRKFPIEIKRVEEVDFKELVEDRYFFNWSAEKKHEIYKLVIKDSSHILGLISLERIPTEWRVHIRLLSVSIENKGFEKIFDRIAGNLISHAAKIAVMDFAELACVSLRPKTELAQHYMQNYDFRLTGITLSIEVPEILNLINTYEND